MKQTSALNPNKANVAHFPDEIGRFILIPETIIKVIRVNVGGTL